MSPRSVVNGQEKGLRKLVGTSIKVQHPGPSRYTHIWSFNPLGQDMGLTVEPKNYLGHFS